MHQKGWYKTEKYYRTNKSAHPRRYLTNAKSSNWKHHMTYTFKLRMHPSPRN